MQSLLILGRQPALGMAELETLYGSEKLTRAGDQAVIVDVDPCLLAFDRLGGSVKFCKLLTTLETVHWRDIEEFLVKVAPGHSQTMPEGKMTIGLSAIGFDVSTKQLEATGLTLKKAIRKTGRSVRLVPNKASELNAAQVIHNKLTGTNGWELNLIKDGHRTIIAQTVKVQDIEAYTARDRERPKRDSKVGMLPPKLAQIIINLAVGTIPEDKLESICETPADQLLPLPLLDQTILDPFCGTGVILQEAQLMGYNVYGTDLEPRMIDYSEVNLKWLASNWRLADISSKLDTSDATEAKWSQPIDFVAAETYLGRPFTSSPSAEVLAQTISDCNLIIKKFLKNIAPQLEPGTRLCLAVPAWKNGQNQFKHLPLIDQIEDLGYNRMSFEHARDQDLIYFREDQYTARQLIVITRN